MSTYEDDIRERTTPSNTKATVFVVDDDASIRRALSRLVKTWGYDVIGFADAESFLEAPLPKQTSCAILDLHLPALDGLEIQAELAKRGHSIPVVFLTGGGDIPTTVEAMRGGAVDFLQKPVDEEALQTAVRRALEISAAAMKEERELERTRRLLADLTPREYETLRCVISGAPNKAIAYRLGITERTVKAHRSQVMMKMQVRSLAELVRSAEALGVEPNAG